MPDKLTLLKDKNFITNFIAILLVVISYCMPEGVYKELLSSISIFALAGAFTNWIAIYMLFEKVPFLYGSGVIPNQFETFKQGIENLIMGQFFTTETLEKFVQEESISGERLWNAVQDNLDYDEIFSGLVAGIESSSMGGMLAMIGGSEALNSIKPSVQEKMSAKIESMVKNMDINVHKDQGDYIYHLQSKVSDIIKSRLSELTPKMVKDIISLMIKQHLGWLVVWGGVFGGLLGIIAKLLEIT